MTGGYLGIDIGGTKVGLRIEGAVGTTPLEARVEWPPGADREADLAALAELVGRARAGFDGPLRAAGVAVPGTVAPDGTLLAWPGRPSWTGLDLAAALAAAVPGVPVRWADDGDLGALAEARHAGHDDLVYLGVGTGVGGGVVIGGRMLPGLARGSCELGHLVVDLDGPVCDCGRRGCVQAFAAGPAVLRAAVAERGSPCTPAELRTAFGRRESWALPAFDRAAVALATAVIGVGELLHPDLALVGGGFAAAHEGLVDLVAEHVHRLTRPGQRRVEVRPAALGGLSSLRGAVTLAREI